MSFRTHSLFPLVKSLLPVVMLCCLTSATAFAQTDRYELGLRVRAAEAAWDAHPETAAHHRAVPKMQGAVMGFFAGQFAAVGKELDEARFALLSDKAPSVEQTWLASLAFIPETRFLDTAATKLPFTLTSFYPVAAKIPEGEATMLDVRIEGKLKDGTPFLDQFTRVPIPSLPFKAELPLRETPEGDYTLHIKLQAGSEIVSQEMTISFATNLRPRLAALKGSAVPTSDTTGATAQSLTKLLTALAEGQTFETDYPAARLLREAEADATAANATQSNYGPKQIGQFWLSLVNGKTTVAARLLAPKAAAAGRPLPLVIALHGAGGSENLFFDGYGRGEIVKLCEKRGWLLVAPRAEGGFGAAPLTDVIEAVAKLYPVDRKQIFLVGHSMGAMQSLSAVQKMPTTFAAVAALSGGGAITPTEALKSLPIFLGVGADDFAAGMTRQTQTALKKAEIANLVYKEYPDCEHLFAVQVALPDVFAFFDKVAAAAH